MATPPKPRTRRASAVQPVPVAEPVARAIKSNLDKLGGSKALGFIAAFQEMQQGGVVRRVTPEGELAKFHRVHNGEVQTANTEQALVDGRWERSKTDVAAFYASSFRLVRVKYQLVELNYG